MHKRRNGERVELSAEEEMELRQQWDAEANKQAQREAEKALKASERRSKVLKLQENLGISDEEMELILNPAPIVE